MPELYKDLTPQERAAYIAAEGRRLVELAEMLGVSLRIDRVAHQPLAMGHARSVVEAWPARERAIPTMSQETRQVFEAISDPKNAHVFSCEALRLELDRFEIPDPAPSWPAVREISDRESSGKHV